MQEASKNAKLYFWCTQCVRSIYQNEIDVPTIHNGGKQCKECGCVQISSKNKTDGLSHYIRNLFNPRRRITNTVNVMRNLIKRKHNSDLLWISE